ncbi:alkaline phosphatase D [Kineococcus xinjiangensis]|uniref:Alkaline phosphatase D n=1 Tax=Kineococcus xinjiangensis TaxID=512762 RepID=A0A2S6IHQ0_9ACTN|nr:alkaline phosphatase D family protein [Kineococcus xinjiangensis]PPK93737.1 alkaline phosphatase D [Kineococcus xinjiangensis]
MPAPTPTPTLARRTLLGGGAALGAGLLTAGARPQDRPLGDPFTLGVASGDPTPDGVVLWTRLAPQPDAEDGCGGMPDHPVPVQWELAADPGFRRIVRRGGQVARPALAHSVHVELAGLPAGREFWYRFRVPGRTAHVSPVGMTRTAPAPHTWASPLTMAFASCAQYEHGWFTAYRRLAEEQPDVVLFLGDYIYEYEANDYVAKSGNVRDHLGPETTTLAGYRQRHSQYKTDPDLQAAHAAAPWIVTWDDHEFENNYADLVAEEQDPYPTPEQFAARRAAAYQAYYENMPLRAASRPNGVDLQLYRRFSWGRLAEFHVLDTRQYRDDQPNGDRFPAHSPERDDPNRSMLGAQQEAWLLDGLQRSPATWDVLAQQVMVHEHDYLPGAARGFNPDSWDGYTASRQRLLDAFVERGVENPVVLTGDVHKHYAADLTRNPSDADADPIGVELVCTSITSGGDGSDEYAAGRSQLADNPDLKLASDQRGYVVARLDRQQLRADFRVLDRVSQPGAAVRTRASFVTEAGNPGLQPV